MFYLYSGVGIFNWYLVLSQFASSDPAGPGGPPRITVTDINTVAVNAHTVIPERALGEGRCIKPLSHWCGGYITAVAVGQRQRLYSGVRIFTRHYLKVPVVKWLKGPGPVCQ
jgi:hypothetical protein